MDQFRLLGEGVTTSNKNIGRTLVVTMGWRTDHQRIATHIDSSSKIIVGARIITNYLSDIGPLQAPVVCGGVLI